MKKQHDFHLEKWFLDFVSNDGEVMIFYVATLKWRNVQLPYTSWITYTPATGPYLKTRFHNVSKPERNGTAIFWDDSNFGLSGQWEAKADPLQARLFESDDGSLDWNCFQPASNVQLKVGEKTLEGEGYVEHLSLTSYPWCIPMNELRWGRFGSQDDYLVWIELRAEERKHWLWLNGEKMTASSIEDDQVLISGKNIRLDLDRHGVLESDKTIMHVVQKLDRFLPGFKSAIPLRFLMADQIRWLSRGILQEEGTAERKGWVIHEHVDFREK